MKLVIPKGATSRITTVFIRHATTGAGLGGLTNASSIAGGYVREGGTGVALAVDEDVTTEGTYQAPSTVAHVRIGTPANNRSGTYELHFHNDLWATGAEAIVITLGGATNMAELPIEVQFSDPVRGLGAPTALPASAAEAAGGLATLSAAQASNGTINANVHRWLTGTPNALTSGRVEVLVGAITNGIIAAASFAAGAFDAVWTVTTRLLTHALGNGVSSTGALDAGTTDSITLPAGQRSQVRVGHWVTITGGAAAGEPRFLAAVNTTSGVCTPSPAFDNTPGTATYFVTVNPPQPTATALLPSVNVAAFLGTLITETSGQIAAAFTKFFNVASPTGTANSLPDAVAGAANGVAIVGSQVDLVNAPNATALTAIATAVWASATRTLSSFGTLVADVAAAVWSAVTRTLTAGTNIVLAKGTGVTGFNDPTAAANAAAVRTELATELARIDAAITSRATVAAVVAALNNLSSADVLAALASFYGVLTGTVATNVANSATSFAVSGDAGTDVRKGVLRLTGGDLAGESNLVSWTGTTVTVLSQSDMPTVLKRFSATPADGVAYSFMPL